MITEKTVLVMGAGASIDYGYPLAIDLLERIGYESVLNQQVAQGQRGNLPSLGNLKILQQLGIKEAEFEIFQKLMLNCCAPSVDLFLENNPRYEEMGRHAIAGEILSSQDETQFRTIRGNKHGRERTPRWGESLLRRLGDYIEEIKESLRNIAVITYNYDVSLEYYLYYQLMTTFGKNGDQAREILEELFEERFIHVYGSVEPLTLQENFEAKYNNNLSAIRIHNAAERIRIMKADEWQSPEFIKAAQLLQNSNKWIFLGFGYHPMNVKRLILTEVGKRQNVTIFGTALNASPTTIERITAMFDGLGMTDIYNEDIKTLLDDRIS